ncbi:diacylglycerol kinase-like protein 2 [Elsinoe australis]|uniref:Diacylglycerol kinase-like protein 2 n=1 Tax=Elsinoe australis TaxID=40998 RepID=A0A4U7AM64_9PEZI|nr:diacylglycerol kinase-like protein 2 [Elsinoe australis]
MTDVTRGTANGADGTWMFKDGVDGEKKLAFLRDTAGEPVLGFELDSKEVVGVIGEEQNHQIIYTSFRENDEVTKTDVPVVHTVKANNPPPSFLQKFAVIRSKSILYAPGSTISVIRSTESGAKQAVEFCEKAVRPTLNHLGILDHAAFHTTQSTETITDLTKSQILQRANEGVEQTIILLSGDGGTIDVVNTLCGGSRTSTYKRPTLITLPLGTGNALSNSYRYNADSTWGLATLARGERRPLPTFRVTFSSGARLVTNEGREERELSQHAGKPTIFGVVVCSWGLHASLVADSDTAHYRQFGAERFQMVAKELLSPADGSEHHAYKGKLQVKDPYTSQWEESGGSEHSYVLATMVSNLEKTFTISPDSKTLDGMMRLIKLPVMNGAQLMEVMTAAYHDGKHVTMDNVGYREIEGLRIDFEEDGGRWRRVCIDGKIVRVENGGWMSVEKEPESLVDIACLQ